MYDGGIEYGIMGEGGMGGWVGGWEGGRGRGREGGHGIVCRA